MKTCLHWRKALVAVVGCLTLLVMGTESTAQEKYQIRTAVRLGYTRPGSPEDKLNKDGSIRPVALDLENTKPVLGGTIYFMVLERSGMEGDTWGSGMAGMDSRFVAGRNRHNQYSPRLDRQAKYIYLYQVVNDRGMDPPVKGVVFAADRDLKIEDIAGSALNLLVDPRYITSWGFFKGTGFVATVPDADIKGVVAVAADGKTSDIRMAVSSNPAFLGQLPEKMYKHRAPSHSLTNMEGSFGIGSANLNLKSSSAYKQVSNIATPVNWQQNMVQAADNVKDPDYVSILYSGSRDRAMPVVDPDEENPVLSVFRCDWRQDSSAVQLGYHSSIFGFTTDLPPVDETIRIEDKVTAARAMAAGGGTVAPGAGRRAPQRIGAPAGGAAEGIVPAQGVAPGTAPTPTPPPPASTPVAGGPGNLGGMSGGNLGGQTSGGGFGFPGAGGGLGGGQGYTTPTTGAQSLPGTANQGQGQAGTNTLDVTGAQLGSITFAPVLTNAQAQNQTQAQTQGQAQTFMPPPPPPRLPPPRKPPTPERPPHGDCPPGEVIPEPAAILLGLLGLPALYLIRRRRANATPVA